jgi:hypothetical protein
MNRYQYLLLKLNEHYIATPGWASDLVSLLKVGVCDALSPTSKWVSSSD